VTSIGRSQEEDTVSLSWMGEEQTGRGKAREDQRAARRPPSVSFGRKKKGLTTSDRNRRNGSKTTREFAVTEKLM